jgi:hypothetical protein
MRKEYIRPAINLIQIRAEHLFLTASIQSNSPIPDATEGETDTWGDWY